MTIVFPPLPYAGHPGSDKLHEECAVFGTFGTSDAAVVTVLGLHALQHRGQEAAGVISTHNNEFLVRKRTGLVGDIFSKAASRSALRGRGAIGHTRYSTVRGQGMRNIQPLFAELAFGGVAMAHNGHITNAASIRQQLIQQGHIFQSDLDSEVLLHLLARTDGSDICERVAQAVMQIKGGFSLVFLTHDRMIGVRDPHGIRPLVLGRRESGGWILSSETCAFDLVGASFQREVQPGEVVSIDANGVRSLCPFPRTKNRLCAFEVVYFSRPDSVIQGCSIYLARQQLGQQAVKEMSSDSPALRADVVVPIPDSGNPAAMGFARQAGLAIEQGIIRNHYVGRTFIEPTQTVRNFGVRMKHSANPAILKGKRVVLVDDSLVRGTTSAKIIELTRLAGAREVHVVIASPPVRFPCVYGIDMPSKDDLLAASCSLNGVRDFLKADSISFLSVEGMYRSLAALSSPDTPPIKLADHVFTGDYVAGMEELETGLAPSLPKMVFQDLLDSPHDDSYSDPESS